MVSDALVTGLGISFGVVGLIAIYLWYQYEQRKFLWIHELYWARNQRLGRSFRDEYDGEVETQFNGRPAKFALAPGSKYASSTVALACRAGFEFSITPDATTTGSFSQSTCRGETARR